jgi:hypothetical protein
MEGLGVKPVEGPPDVVVVTECLRQLIAGFGACFNELSPSEIAL